MKEWNAPHIRSFILGMIGYTVTIMLAAFLLGGEYIDNTGVAIVVALLPVVPFAYAMIGMVGNARSKDEMQQQVYLESVLITALLTGALTFSYGLLELFDLAPHIPVFYVAPLMIIIWGITNAIVGRRYG